MDEVQPQLLPRVHHGSVPDEPADESSPVSVLQAARAFGRACEARRYTTLGIVVDATPSPPRHTTEQVFEVSDADAAQAPTAEPTPEPTSEPTAEPTSEPTENA